MRRLARRTILKWQNYRFRKAMRRAIPALKKLDMELAEHRRNHRAALAGRA